MLDGLDPIIFTDNPGRPQPPPNWRRNRGRFPPEKPPPPARPLLPAYGLIRPIELESHRKITMSTSAENLLDCKKQLQSPLFRLPAELRAQIYGWACSPYYKERFDETDYYYRPHCEGQMATSTTLLRTCRRIFLEAHHIPLGLAEPVFFFTDPPNQPPFSRHELDEARLAKYLRRLTPNNRKAWARMRIFAQVQWLRKTVQTDPGLYLGRILGAAPASLTITLRLHTQTDWDHWNDYRLDQTALRMLLETPAVDHVREIRLELEALETKSLELEELIARIRAMKLESRRMRLENGQDVDVSIRRRWVIQDELQERHWTAPPAVGRPRWPVKTPSQDLVYKIVTLTWKSVEVKSGSAKGVLRYEADPSIAEEASQITLVSELPEFHAIYWSNRWLEEDSLLRFVGEEDDL